MELYSVLKRHTLKLRRQVENKRMERYNTNTNHKKVTVAISISDKVGFKIKCINKFEE